MLSVRKFKRKAVLTLATTAMLAGSVAVSGPADAASSPIAACGGGTYHVIDHHDLGGAATIYLLYNGRTNCVVTWARYPYAGHKNRMAAWMQKKGQSGFEEGGEFMYYAGPVKVDAAGACISWGGEFAHSTNVDFAYTSSFGHCGA